jgi:TrmH family RNA methyltransferase
VFIGSEGAGVPRDLIGQMDELVAIPQAKPVESLNAGVAASIVLYECARKQLFTTEAQRTQRKHQEEKQR